MIEAALLSIALGVNIWGFKIVRAIRAIPAREKGKTEFTDAEMALIAGLVEKRIRDNIKAERGI
jgi:hypothetical protein